jgi:hypothetical protein
MQNASVIDPLKTAPSTTTGSYSHFRNYTLRRIRDGFRDPVAPGREAEKMLYAKENLQLIKRQVRKMYIKKETIAHNRNWYNA